MRFLYRYFADKYKNIYRMLLVVSFALLAGCGVKDKSSEEAIDVSQPSLVQSGIVVEDTTDESGQADYIEVSTNLNSAGEEVSENGKSSESEEILSFVDAFGESYETVINQLASQNPYDKENFIHDGEKLSYQDDSYTYRLGIDVSKYQGNVNWEKVKAAGYDFAFIRIGFRGYGQAGNLGIDEKFEQNIQNARAAGLDVGVYFFAQAINEEEAVEEAHFVMDALEGYELSLPIVYDPESIRDQASRTDNVSGEQFTANTLAFCKTISEAGYKPAIYANMLWEAFELDMSQLKDFTFWYADYEEYPQTPYDFEYWQYSESAKVDGVEGNCDVDIQLIPNR